MTVEPIGVYSLEPNSGQRLELRPGQAEALAAIETAREGGADRGYVNMATGLGKTYVAAHDVARFRAENPDARVLYMCHNTDILRQARNTFSDALGTTSHGNFFGGTYEDQEDIVYATFQSMNRKLGGGKVHEAFDEQEFDYIVVDESHHGPAETYRQVIEHFKPRFMLGLTATPDRQDQQDIREIFGEELHTELLEDAIAKGHLARPNYRVLTDHVRKLKEIETDLGKVSLSQLNREIFVRRRDGEIADLVAEHLYERENPRTIVFCNSINQAEHMAELLPGDVGTLHSKLPKNLQEERLSDFKAGKLDMLVTVDKLNEGVDVPEANVVVFLRSTESRTVWLQQLGRGLRKTDGKEEVLVLDFAASWERIQDIQNLRNRVGVAYEQIPKAARQAKSPFRFEFSEEALQAVEVIRYARDQKNRPKPIQIQPRVEKWQREEAELMAMLGITQLPSQRMTASMWQLYSERIASGDQAAVEELLMRNLRILYGKAKYYHEKLGSSELTVEDHFQHAIEGYYTSISKHPPVSGESLKDLFNFNVYSWMQRTAASRGLIRIPGHVGIELQKYKKSEVAAQKSLGDSASPKEIKDYIKEHSDLSVDHIEELEQVEDTICYDTLLPLEAAEDVVDPQEIEAEAHALVQRHVLSNALKSLPQRERRVIELRYGLNGEKPQTLDESGRKFNVTRERIRQIENVSLKKLRSMRGSQPLREIDPVRAAESNRPVLVSGDPEERAVARRLGFRALAEVESDLAKQIVAISPTYISLRTLLKETREEIERHKQHQEARRRKPIL